MKAIPRRLNRCVSDGEVFKPGSEYFSYLDPDGNRHDYCLNCWQEMEEEGSFWKGKIPDKKGKVSKPDAKALAIFRELKNPKHLYVLALYLQRKKQLIRRTQTLYEIPDTGEVFDIETLTISAEESLSIASDLDLALSS